MSTATHTLPRTTYTTRSGSVYELSGSRIRRANGDGSGPVDDWTPYREADLIPAAARWPGQQGRILEVLLADGERLYTSPVAA